MIEVNNRKLTKAKKLHCVPLLACLRGPLTAYIEGWSRDEYLFADAPRPSSPKLRASHEASKWFGRFSASTRLAGFFMNCATRGSKRPSIPRCKKPSGR